MRLFTGISLALVVALAIFQTLLLQPVWHDVAFSLAGYDHSLQEQRHQLLDHFRFGTSLQGLDFSSTELKHIADIDRLLHQESSVVWLIMIALLLVVFIFTAGTRKSPPRLVVFGEAGKLEIKAFQKGCKMLIAALVVSAIFIGLQFEPLFRMAHSLLFTGGNWEFDPTTDLIIQLYPPRFFLYFFPLLLILVVAGLLVTYFLLGLVKKRWLG